MDTTCLRSVLSASLDPKIPTSVLRLAAGLVDEIKRKLAVPMTFGERTQAYISWEQVEDLTGVDRKTANRHIEDLSDVGLVSYEASGNQEMHEWRPTAGSWTRAEAKYAPVDLDLSSSQEVALCGFLDPANDCWMRRTAGNSGYRAMLVILATYGFEDVLLSGPKMADLLGITRANGLLALKALESTSLVQREGRLFRVWTSVLENPLWEYSDRHDAERVEKREKHRRKWVLQREVHLYGESLADREARREVSRKIMEEFLNPVTVSKFKPVEPSERQSWSEEGSEASQAGGESRSRREPGCLGMRATPASPCL